MKLACDGMNSSFKLAKRLLEKFQPGKIVLSRFADVFNVVQRRERGGLRQQIEVERLPDFFQRGHKVGVPDAVADAQAGQAVDFRKRPHQNQVGPDVLSWTSGDQIHRVVQKINVRLVHHQQHVVGHFVDEPDDVLARRAACRWDCSGSPRTRCACPA